MKLTILLLTAAMLAAQAGGFAQSVTISGRNLSLHQVFTAIEKQTGYVVFTKKGTVPDDRNLTFSVFDQPLESFLALALKGKALKYSIQGKTIIIAPKPALPEVVKDSVGAVAVSVMAVTGRVVDLGGQPLEGVSIKLKKSSKGTSSAADGRFTIEANRGDVLVFSRIGYQQREYRIDADNNINIVLALATQDLDKVVVQAYGTTSKRFTTSNIGVVRAEDIEKQPVNNPILALQGRVPGVMVTPQSGIPGTRVVVKIQGTNSIRGGTQPFYVVDGVPFNSTMIQPHGLVNSLWQQGSGNIPLGEASTGGSPLNYINAADIESIEVLKDADATAIYGSRAANGAIIITTKKGKPGPLHIDANLRSGYTEMSRQLNYMNLDQYRAMRLEAKRNNNQAILATDYDLNGVWGDKINTDFQDYFFGKGVSYNDLQVSISGGGGTTNYRVNLGYLQQNSIYGSSSNDQKISMGLNLNTASANRRFRMDISLNAMVDRNRLPAIDLTGTILQLPPNAPALYNEDGSFNWAPDATGQASWANPMAILEEKNTARTNSLTGNLLLTYELLKGLKLSGSLGYSRMDMEAVRTQPLTAMNPFDQFTPVRVAFFSSSASNSYSVEPQLYYSTRWGATKVDWTVGSTIQQSMASGKGFTAWGAPSDDLLENIAAASELYTVGSVARTYRYNALFSRLTLNHHDELLLNLTARRDGSSRFGPENRFHNFGAVGFGWIFTQRNWLREKLPILSFGKLRVSYGTTGNDQIGDYTYYDLYNAYGAEIPYQGLSLLNQSGGYNPTLEWEQTHKLNLGLDLGFCADRLSLSVNYALNRSSNLLQQTSVPRSAGVATSIYINFPGTVENRNLELSLTSDNLRSGPFNWRTSLNLTWARNRLVSIADLSLVLSADNLVVGKSIDGAKVYKYLGVDPLTGNYRFADRNGNPVTRYNTVEDRTGFVELSPRIYGGLNNRLSWKGLSLDVQANLVRQNAKSYLAASTNPHVGVIIRNEPLTGFVRWHAPGDVSLLNKFGTVDNTNALIGQTDQGYEDATYLRIGTVALGWELPVKWLKPAGLRQAAVGIQGQNLWTITNYSGLDPETGSGVLPQPRTIVVNLKLGI